MYGWAYGSKSGYKVGGKKIALAISAGINASDFSTTGRYKYTMKELLRPFELTFEYIKADHREPFVYYGLKQDLSAEHIERSVPLYLDFIDGL